MGYDVRIEINAHAQILNEDDQIHDSSREGKQVRENRHFHNGRVK